jgi:hypothetical protein
MALVLTSVDTGLELSSQGHECWMENSLEWAWSGMGPAFVVKDGRKCAVQCWRHPWLGWEEEESRG